MKKIFLLLMLCFSASFNLYSQEGESSQETKNIEKIMCSMCLENISCEDASSLYRCRRIFHKSCADRCNQQPVSPACPECRLANIIPKVSSDQLINAARNNSLSALNRLIEAGVDINATNIYGETALMEAARYGRSVVANRLIEAGADVNATNIYAETVLMEAARDGFLDLVNILIEAGADVNATDRFGKTALMKAERYGRLAVVNRLIEAGADINAALSFNFNVR